MRCSVSVFGFVIFIFLIWISVFIHARRVRGHLVRPLDHVAYRGLQKLASLRMLGDEAREQFVERTMQHFVPLNNFIPCQQFRLSKLVHSGREIR